MKLVKATIPMCPKCDGELIEYLSESYCCPTCGDECLYVIDDPDWGYYLPDIGGVVTRINDAANDIDAKGFGHLEQGHFVEWLRTMASRLRGEK